MKPTPTDIALVQTILAELEEKAIGWQWDFLQKSFSMESDHPDYSDDFCRQKRDSAATRAHALQNVLNSALGTEPATNALPARLLKMAGDYKTVRRLKDRSPEKPHRHPNICLGCLSAHEAVPACHPDLLSRGEPFDTLTSEERDRVAPSLALYFQDPTPEDCPHRGTLRNIEQQEYDLLRQELPDYTPPKCNFDWRGEPTAEAQEAYDRGWNEEAAKRKLTQQEKTPT